MLNTTIRSLNAQHLMARPAIGAACACSFLNQLFSRHALHQAEPRY
ncbi:hypothetical protein [Pararhizobium sp. PWRC1-1]